MPIRIALVGDFSPAIPAHRGINESMRLASAFDLQAEWVHTTKLSRQALNGVQGVWCVPGSPYADTDAVLDVIQWARMEGVPFLGTCGGFQHALLEFARHVLGRSDAAHAELEPNAAFPLIAPLACPLVETSQRIFSMGQGIFARHYGPERTEGFCCSFGLNPSSAALFEGSDLEVVARSKDGQVRAVELRGHPFFIGTLFQPERAALKRELHPLIRGFVQAASERPVGRSSAQP
jgi:CTP synthase (UTP-ammonia lyase)